LSTAREPAGGTRSRRDIGLLLHTVAACDRDRSCLSRSHPCAMHLSREPFCWLRFSACGSSRHMEVAVVTEVVVVDTGADMATEAATAAKGATAMGVATAAAIIPVEAMAGMESTAG